MLKDKKNTRSMKFAGGVNEIICISFRSSFDEMTKSHLTSIHENITDVAIEIGENV